jgi:hypothetical protein
VLLLAVGFSGCTESEKKLLTPANIVLRNVTFSPSHPVDNEDIVFTVQLENTGDNATAIALGLNWTAENGQYRDPWSNINELEGHSQQNITLSTGTGTRGEINGEGNQSFKIVYHDYQQSKDITLKIVDIEIEPGAPDISLAATGLDNQSIRYQSTFGLEGVYVYYEYQNIKHNGVINTSNTITVYHQESGVQYYSNSSEDTGPSEADIWMRLPGFNTWGDVNGFWPSGDYYVDIVITDRTTGLTGTKTLYFTLR